MFNFTKKQQCLLGDSAIAVGVLVLAFMLQEADTEAVNRGMLTVAVALLIRFGGFKMIGCNRNNGNK